MPGENIQDWSPSATLNGNSDSAINWSEGQPRASVNNSARSMMAAHAKDRNLQNGSIVTGGTINAQTFFSGLNYTTIPTGLRVLLKIGSGLTNTDVATLSMDGLTAVSVKDALGADLEEGALRADTFVELVFNGTNWILLTTFLAAAPPLSPPVTIINQTIINVTTGPIALVDFTDLDTTTYSRYSVVITNFVPEINDTALTISFSTDGGATFPITGTDYNGVELFISQTFSNVNGGIAWSFVQGMRGFLAISWNISNVETQFPSNIVLDLFQFQPGKCPTVFWQNGAYLNAHGFATISNGRGYAIETTGANAIRLWPTVGNIKEGKITLIGYL